MKTKRQVLTDMYRLQKKWADKFTFVDVRMYNQDADIWVAYLRVTDFQGGEIVFSEDGEWTHYSYYADREEARNEKKIEEFIKKVEEYEIHRGE